MARSSWEEQADREQEVFESENRVYEIGARTLELSRRGDSVENHSVVENSLGLIREFKDPLDSLKVLDALSEALEIERARIIASL